MCDMQTNLHKEVCAEVTEAYGNAFDITFDFTEVDRKKINGFEHYKYECIIKNHKEEVAEVHFEHYDWGIWEMVYATHEYSKKHQGLLNSLLMYRLTVR